MKNPILTIAIPTYNRALEIAECLDVLLPQVNLFRDEIEFIISDNGSTDTTQNILSHYKKKYPFIKIFKNPSNYGPDYNFVKCYKESSGDFFWVFSDDDNINPTLLIKLMAFLKVNVDFSLIYFNHSSNQDEINAELAEFSIISYVNMIDFLDKATWLPFISAIIANKKYITENNISIDFDKFIGTSLVQLTWFFESYIHNNNCIFVENKVIYNRPNNSGGYNYFKTFLESYNFILDYYVKKGLDINIKHKINNIHIKRDFKIILTHGVGNYTYSLDGSMVFIFKNLYIYSNFWIILFPIIISNYLKKYPITRFILIFFKKSIIKIRQSGIINKKYV